MNDWTVKDVLDNLSSLSGWEPLAAPKYVPHALNPRGPGSAVGLAVESMKRHMTSEGWEIFAGLESAGYCLAGYEIVSERRGSQYVCKRPNLTDVNDVLKFFPNLDTVVVQDVREWDSSRSSFREKRAHFSNVEELRNRPDVFNATILKDAHQDPSYHSRYMDSTGTHAVIHYYNADVVCKLAPYLRREHLVRTYHTLDRDLVPEFKPGSERKGCLLSGAVSGAYPLRMRLFEAARNGLLPCTDTLRHPGYNRAGCKTPEFLRTLGDYKVAICTASRYGYTLRKFAEATACGCVVITDLPVDEKLPEIDGNLIRLHPHAPLGAFVNAIREAVAKYDDELQRWYAQRAMERYDFRVEGKRLAESIETLRRNYNGSKP